MNTMIKVELHQGKALKKLAENYSNLLAVIAEIVQNAVDSSATRIEVVVDMLKRILSVYDNGEGASQEKVTEALKSIGNTMKKSDKYGQFGLGLISPISIAKKFTFTSCPGSRRNGYVEYTFVTNDIEKQSQVSVPFQAIENLSFDPTGKQWWRTAVVLYDITKDKRISRIEINETVRDLALKFGEEIRRRNIQISVRITDVDKTRYEKMVVAPEFSGKPLSIYEKTSRECGEVRAELFIAQLTRRGREGTISFGTMDNPSRISTKQFVDCAGDFLDPQTSRALKSGIFEGRILCRKIVLHTDRTKFESNDALFALCEILDKWYREIGKKSIEEAEEQTSNNRFQRIGTQVMRFAETLLGQKEFESVAEQISIGTIGINHARVPKGSVIGQDDGKSIAVGGNPFENKDHNRKTDGTIVCPPKTDHPEHTPGIVYGGRGRKRTEVKGNSTGLRFEYVEMEDFRIPFDFDSKTGRLSFNVRNPNWGQCQENDVFLQEYHMAVVIMALSLELYKDQVGNMNPEVKKFAHENLTSQTFTICNGKALLTKS